MPCQMQFHDLGSFIEYYRFPNEFTTCLLSGPSASFTAASTQALRYRISTSPQQFVRICILWASPRNSRDTRQWRRVASATAAASLHTIQLRNSMDVQHSNRSSLCDGCLSVCLLNLSSVFLAQMPATEFMQFRRELAEESRQKLFHLHTPLLQVWVQNATKSSCVR